VLVVGAGPTGLTLACELWRHGVPCRLIDDGTGPSPPEESRALAIWERTLEVFRTIGILEKIEARAKHAHGMNAYSQGKRVLHVGTDLHDPDVACPSMLILPQGQTERLLVERLQELGGSVEWQTRVTDLHQDDLGVTAQIVDPQGQTQQITATWLVGCDGPSSVVRHSLGLAFNGAEYPETFLLADAELHWNLPDDEGHVLLIPEGGVVGAIPLPEAGHWRLIDATGGPAPEDTEGILERFRELIHSHGHPEAEIGQAVWASAFHLHRRLADRFRVGRCFLAGDAAHVHSPAGGQGMNTGVQDAHNLAWKLALVISRSSPETILDSYELERRPVAEEVLKRTDFATRAITLRHSVTEAARNSLAAFLTEFDFVRRRIARTLAELDLQYRHSPIVAEDDPQLLSAIFPSGLEGGWQAYARFNASLHAGDRAPDVEFPLPAEKRTARMHELLDPLRHTLFLFESKMMSDLAADAATAIAQLLCECYSKVIAGCLITEQQRPQITMECPGRAVSDVDGSLHHAFGAASPCLYLIRPDGRIAYRSMPPEPEKFERFLRRIFR
jgi:2-polyprenyl-6-methoxyphenol hydroxylase-like FAD-dependent oxidoreductase